MSLSCFLRERRSAVALLFAIMAVPVIGLVGIAVDYGFWNQAYASMSLAASTAALNAVKVTAAATTNGETTAAAEAAGQAAGKQWFLAQLGPASNASHISANVSDLTVSMTAGATTTATVQYNATNAVPSIFGNLFGMRSYPINIQAKAEIVTSPYLNVEILVDNSPSMEIGATPGDIAAMNYLTPCSVPAQNGASQDYSAYACTSGNTYDGQNSTYGEESCGIVANYTGETPVLGLTASAYPAGTQLTPTGSASTAPVCANLVSGSKKPVAQAPCAFACHYNTTATLSATSDYYGLARSTIGKATPCYKLTFLAGVSNNGADPGNCAITLRFDLVKNAVDETINRMQADNLSAINNLNVGVYWFATSVNQVYPAPTGNCAPAGSTPNNTLACQAGNDWATALSLVGAPPTTPDTLDTGIQPYTGGNGGDTDMHATLTSLATQYLTAAGDGSSPTSPLKVLFLVTDGLNDPSSRVESGVSSADCNLFKNMGYTVYVVFTPYYPLMNPFYLGNDYTLVEGSGSSSLQGSLKACSSDPNYDYLEANPTDASSIQTALDTFLKRALIAAAKFTQ
jgi:Flp pilus assembly protein TadG